MSGPIILVLRIFLALALYGFLSWALWMFWLDLRQQGRSLEEAGAYNLVLTPQIQDKVKRMNFNQSEVIIGRDPASDCFLDDQTISVRHARLAFHHGQWWVEDLGSHNGTFLNQDPVMEAVVITSGDELRCGGVLIKVHLGKDQPAARSTS